MSSRLDKILAATRRRIAAIQPEALESWMKAAGSAPPTKGFAKALRRPGRGTRAAAPLRVIGELKRRSPSAGDIYPDLDPVAAASALEAAGCSALSVLTEPHFFGGSLETLQDARASADLPLLRKDFILDPRQVVEARAHGADAILLLAAALDDRALVRCAEEARRWGLDVLAEAHRPSEAERLRELDVEVLGINARDLRTFEVNLPRALELCARFEDRSVLVAESGVVDRASAERVAAAGVDAVLVGEGLMRGGRPGERFVELFGERESRA